jgi:hypothetical protein
VADWPLAASGRLAPLGFSATIPTGITVTNGAANVKGNYAAIGNAPFDAVGIILVLGAKSGTTDHLVDIAFGASGSERVVIENIMHTGASSGAGSKNYFFPLRVPANTRLTVRAQGASAATVQAAIHLIGDTFAGMPGYDKFVTYGAVVATSTGTALTNPGAGAWGAWSQIAPTSSYDHAWVMGIIGDASLSTRTASQKWAWQTGVGGAGNEVPIGPEQWFTSTSSVFGLNTFTGLWVPIARNQRLAMRYGSSAATNLGANGIIIAAG